MKRFVLKLVALLVLFAAPLASAAEIKAVKPGPRDKCAVCGMFVARYGGSVAQIQFRDGSVAFFDGAKDLFRYYRALPRYNPAKKLADIGQVIVTDYYNVSPIDARSAHFVIGSDVNGPMGKELIPFQRLDEAREFAKDHRGTRVLRFSEVNDAVLKGLE